MTKTVCFPRSVSLVLTCAITLAAAPAARADAAWDKEIADNNATLDKAEAELATCCDEMSFFEQKKLGTLPTPFSRSYSLLMSARAHYTQTAWGKRPEAQAFLERLAAFEDKITATIKLPKDRFSEKDHAKLKASFKSFVATKTGKPVLGVAIVTDRWNRKTATVRQGLRMIKFDRARAEAFVAVKGEGEKAEVWWVQGYKDWLDGEKIKFDEVAPSRAGLMAAKNLEP